MQMISQCLSQGKTIFRSLNENIKLMKTAKINWDKSEGYNMGQWDEVGYPKLPGGLRWGRVKSCRCFYR